MTHRVAPALAMLVVAAGPAWGQGLGPASELDLTGLITSLMIVIGLIVGAAYVLKRSPLALSRRSEGPLSVVASLPIGPKERLLLVEARGREVLLAVSPAGIAMLDGSQVGATAAHGAAHALEPRRDVVAAANMTDADAAASLSDAVAAAGMADAAALRVAPSHDVAGALAGTERRDAPMSFAERLSAGLSAGYRALTAGDGR